MRRRRNKPPAYQGYYKTSEEFQVWKKKHSVPETAKKNKQKRSDREKKAEEYYRELPLKPGLGSVLAMARFRKIKRRNTTNYFLIPPTILVTRKSFLWLKSDPKTGNIQTRDLDVSTGTTVDDTWPKEFMAACATFRRSPNVRAPPYVAVRRTFFEGNNPERSRTVVVGPSALLGHLQKIAFDRRHRDPTVPSTRPEPEIEIWQALVWGRGMYASVYRVRWRRNGTGSGFCISNVNHCNKEEEEDTAETRKSCCSLPESIPYIVSRDCCENNNNDDDDEIEKHQRRVTMSVRALTIPLSIAARVVRQYEMSNKNVKILSATFDFVKTRTQEWIMLQMKSFRLTKSSSLSFTSSSILPSMANITTTKNDTTQKLKKKKKISSRLHLKLRKCTICKREIERNGPSFTMTPDMMVKLTKELQIMNILSNKDDNDTNNDNYSTLVTVAERQKRRFRYRTSHVCTTCNKLYTKSRELRDKYAKQQRLLGLENVAHSKTRRTLVGQNRSTKLTSKIGHCRVYLFVHDIAKSQHSTQQSLFFTLVEKLKRHKTPSLRLALLPTGQNNTCPNLTFNIKDSKLSLRQCCAFDFFCDRETLRDLTSKHTKSRSRLKVQFALSTNDDEEENDESLYYGELPIVRESEDDMEMNENHFEHLWISLETPISYSPLRPSKDLKVRISVGMVWTRYGSDVVTSKEGLDSNLRFRKLHTRPNIYGNLNKKNVVLLSGMPSGWFTRVQIADDPETYERLKRLGWSKGEEVEEKKKKKEIEKLTSKKQISSTLRLLVNYGPDVLCEKGEMKIRDIFAEWGLEREDSNHVVSFLKNSNSWDHVVNVPRRDLWHAEIARDIQSRSCDVRAEARYHLCPEDRVDNNEDAEKEDDVGTTVVPPFVVSLLRGGHMISGSSVLPAREYFPKSFVRHLLRAAVPSVCHAVVSVGMIVDKGALLSAEIVTSAIGKLKDETVEGFCFAHGYTRLYASDYYCVECDRANLSSVG